MLLINLNEELIKKIRKNIFIVPPRQKIGIVPIKIDLIIFINKYQNIFWIWSFNLKISSLKYQARAKTLPSWINADNDIPGSSIPKKREIIFKWAELLTGINSVKPWINPYKINLKYSKNLDNFLIN